VPSKVTLSRGAHVANQHRGVAGHVHDRAIAGHVDRTDHILGIVGRVMNNAVGTDVDAVERACPGVVPIALRLVPMVPLLLGIILTVRSGYSRSERHSFIHEQLRRCRAAQIQCRNQCRCHPGGTNFDVPFASRAIAVNAEAVDDRAGLRSSGGQNL
jgi:hypothetical protein